MKEPTLVYRTPRRLVEWLKAHNMRDGCNCLRCRGVRVLMSLHRLVFDRGNVIPKWMRDALKLMAFVVAAGVAMALAFAVAMVVIYFLWPWGT